MPRITYNDPEDEKTFNDNDVQQRVMAKGASEEQMSAAKSELTKDLKQREQDLSYTSDPETGGPEGGIQARDRRELGRDEHVYGNYTHSGPGTGLTYKPHKMRRRGD